MFTAVTDSPAPSFQWKVNGTNAGGNSYTFTSSTLLNNDIITVNVTDPSCNSGIPFTSNSITINVNPIPVTTITPSGPTTFCQGGSVILTSSAGASYLWTAGETSQSIIISESGSYSVTMTDSNGCSATSAPTTVTVNPLSVANITPSGALTFCQGGSVILTASAGASYLWTTGETTQSITVSTSGSYSVTVYDANGCSATAAPTTVTVNPLPVANITPSGALTFCQGGSAILTASEGASYLWTTGETTQSITVSTSGSYSVTVNDANGCSATAAPTTVTVNPLPIANVTPSGALTFCQGGSVILTSSAGATYLWTTGETSQSITVSTSGSYSVTMTDANGCSATSNPVTVAVNNITSGTVSSDQTICNGGNPVAFTSTAPGTGSGVINYRWESSVSPFSTWTTIAGAVAETYDAPSGLTSTTEYRRIAISTLNGVACESVPATFLTVIAQSIPAAGAIAGNQTICNGGDPAAFTSTAPGTGSGIITYRWESSVSPFTTWTTIAGATAAAYDAPAGLTVTTEYRRITISTLNGVDCESVPTSFVTVTVQSIPASGVIAGNQTICNGGDPAAFTSTAPGTGNGTITYRWESSVSPFTTWTTISGATSTTYNVPSGLTTTTEYRRITISTLNGVACESMPASFLTVTVQSIPASGVIAGNQTICNGGNPAAFTSTAPGAGSGVINYRWESSVSPFSNWTIITGATSETYDAPSGLTSTTEYRRTAISTLNGVVCESVPGGFVTVTVQNIPAAGAIAGNQTICNGGDPAAFTSTAPGTGSGTITYRWESSVNPFTTWTTIAGATSAAYDALSGLTSTTEYRRIAISTLNGVSCESVPTGFVTVTVQSIPAAGVIAGNQTICNGGDPAAFTSTTPGTGSGTITYRWESSVSPFTTWTTITGATAATYNVPSGLTTTTEYRRITISTLNGVACESVPATYLTVIVQSIPTAGVIAGNQTICIGSDPATFIETVSPTGDGTLTYQWQSNTTGCGSAFSNIPGATTSTYNPSGLAVTTYFRRIITSTLNGASCSVNSNCLTVTVNPLPTVAAIAGPTSVCTGNNITLTNTTPEGLWSSSNTGIATISSTGVVSGISDGTVTIYYSVTNVNGCTRIVTRTVTVNSTTVTITPSGPTTFCRGNSVTLTASGASTYSWSPVEGLSITTGAIVIATPEITTTYTVTGTGSNGCTATAQILVTVLQRPEGIMSSDPAVCSGSNSGTISLTITDGSSVIGWESSVNGGTTWSPYTPTIDTYTTAYLNLTQTTVYRALLQLSGCQAYSSIGIVPVNNVLKPVVTSSATVSCLNTAIVLHASGYGQPPFPVEDFQNANPAGWSGDDAGGNNGDPNSNWALTNNGKTFNGILYNSQAPPTNTKFFIVTGITDEADHNATMTAPPFSLVGTINPVLSFYTALNFNNGTTGIVQISTDGGATYTNLITYTGPATLGNPNNGWINVTYSLVSYINQPDVRIRFNYTGTAGSNWALDNIGIISTFQPIVYHWSPTDHMTPPQGNTADVTILPDVGLHTYCVSSTTAAGCESDTVCITVNVLPLPACNISGIDGPVCPSSVNVFTAPASMSRYEWSISGNGSITAGSSTQTVTVSSGSVCNSSFTLTLSVTDNNGCISTCSKTVSVEDHVPPVITGCPANLTFCSVTGDVYSIPPVSGITDDCGLPPIITFQVTGATVRNGSGNATGIFNTGISSITWYVSDTCGNTTTCTTTITINPTPVTSPIYHR
jgi:hypothetical protein